MSKYSVGANFERTAKRILEKEGWFVCRSAGSKSCVDLIAFKLGEVKLIQCKKNGVISPSERKQILELAKENRFQAYLVKREGKEIIFVEIRKEVMNETN